MSYTFIRAGDGVLDRFGNQMGAIGERKAAQVMARALNRVGNPAFTAVRRELIRQTSAPRQAVDRQVSKQMAFAGNKAEAAKLRFVIRASGRALPLSMFKPRQFSYGARARVWGRMQSFPGMFGAPGDNPKVVARLGGGVFVRETSKRLPIRQAYGPSLPQELVLGAAKQAFLTRAARLSDAVAHELGRVLPT